MAAYKKRMKELADVTLLHMWMTEVLSLSNQKVKQHEWPTKAEYRFQYKKTLRATNQHKKLPAKHVHDNQVTSLKKLKPSHSISLDLKQHPSKISPESHQHPHE